MKMTEDELKKYDIAILVDMSKSMTTPDVDNKERWLASREAVEGWARDGQKYDQNGITVGFFNSNFTIHEDVTPDKVVQIYTEHTPAESTSTHKVIEHMLNRYLNGPRKKPIIILVITDGGSDDNEKLAKVIAAATQKMNNDEEIGIQFIQIGHDASCTKMLKMLDDDLKDKYGAKFDIVDTTTYEEAAKMPFLALCEKTLND